MFAAGTRSARGPQPLALIRHPNVTKAQARHFARPRSVVQSRNGVPSGPLGFAHAQVSARRLQLTAISTVISQGFCAHGSDSFITMLKDGGLREVVETERTKLVQVSRFRGALAYFGLAQLQSKDKVVFSMLDWLKHQIQKTGAHTAEAFAEELAIGLNAELAKHRFERETDKGIGIHFTAYERVEDYWIP
jgi:hypothetical protein